MNQYKDFAAIYDELINADVDYKAWADKILECCMEANTDRQSYLDLACGTGNMTVELAKAFKSVWALDLSSSMLTEAESKLRGTGIKARYVCQDICEIKLNQKFDLITCCLDSTNYITDESDLKSYFTGVLNHLKDNGLFVFDINSYNKLTNILGNNTFTYDNDEVVYIWENYLEGDSVEMNLTFFVKAGEKYKRFDEQHCERAYTEDFIENLINESGLRIVKKLNNYEEKVIDEECERITYVLTKKTKEENHGR